MNDARQFAIDLDAEFRQFEENQLKLIKQKIAMQVLSGVTLKMPVDTGRARGNTTASINTMDTTVTDATDPTGQATISKGQSAIFGDQDPYDAIWIANSLPYINQLENGWSNQAPGGMFALTVAEVQTQFARVE